MSTAIQRRRGTTAQHAAFTGLTGETTVDTDKNVVVVHNGATAGGFPLLRENGSQNLVTTGTVTGASLSPTSSTVPTNGIYLPAANSVAISTGGSGRLFVDANGSVRINSSIQATDSGGLNIETTGSGNTLSPLALLNRGNTNNTGVSINFRGVSAAGQETDYANIRMLATDTSSRNGAIALFTASGGSVSERLRITSSGLVGIGTSSPGNLLNVVRSTSGGVVSEIEHTDAATVATHAILNLKTAATSNADLLRLTNGSGFNSVFTASGRLGIGNTSPGSALTISTQGSVLSGTGNNYGLYINPTSGGIIHIDALNTSSSNTSLTLRTYNNGTYNTVIQSISGNETTFSTGGTERARIDSSGRLLVGTSTNIDANSKLQIESDANDKVVLKATSAVANNGSQINWYVGSTWKASIYGGNDASSKSVLKFETTADGASSPTERMRINNAGRFKCTSDGSYASIDADAHGFRNSTVGNWVLEAVHGGSGADVYGINSQFAGSSPNNTSSWFYLGSDTTANRFIVYSNGGIANYQGNNVNLCDRREKKNIEELESTWDCLKHWELKKFHYNADEDTDAKRYGVIAQQVEEHCPEIISEWVKQKAKPAKLDDDGNELEPAKEEIVRMGVKEQQMYWMPIKALQEAQVRIETLEAKVAALEAQ